MARTRRLEELVASSVERIDLPVGPLVVGLSGGADSAALALLCMELDRKTQAVHINHGLPHSPMMEKAAIEIADALGLPLEVVAVEVPKGPSPEGQARRVRYSAFAEAVSSEDALLAAHMRNDDVETVVFNLVRGTGARGLGGIPYHRPPNVYRPMLAISRSDTRELATLAGLEFVDDPMNNDLSLSRNVIRSRILPALGELNPRLVESVARMARSVAADNAYLDSRAAAVDLTHSDQSVGVSIGDLIAIPKPVADRVLKTVLAHALGSDGVTNERIERLWDVIEGGSERQQMAGQVGAERRGSLLMVGSSSGSEGPLEVGLNPGWHRQGRIEFEVIQMDGVCMVAPFSPWHAVFPPDSVLVADQSGMVLIDGVPAWQPGEKRFPVAWYEPGSVGYLSVFATEVTGWTSSH